MNISGHSRSAPGLILKYAYFRAKMKELNATFTKLNRVKCDP